MNVLLTRSCTAQAVAILLAVMAASCGKSSTPTAASSTAPTEIVEVFSGTIPVGGSAFYAFTMNVEGALQVTLTNLNTSALVPAGVPVRLGLGQPSGEGCGVTDAIAVQPALSHQLLRRLTPSIYCIEIRDPGTLARDAIFSIRIAHL